MVLQLRRSQEYLTRWYIEFIMFFYKKLYIIARNYYLRKNNTKNY